MERAGRSLAEGVWDLLPRASFVPYHGPSDKPLPEQLFAGRRLVLCDAVVNSGRSVREALEELLSLRPAQVAVLCLVMQEAAQELARKFPLVRFAAPRVSSNRFTGSKGTDTGNRLYNNTCLD